MSTLPSTDDRPPGSDDAPRRRTYFTARLERQLAREREPREREAYAQAYPSRAPGGSARVHADRMDLKATLKKFT